MGSSFDENDDFVGETQYPPVTFFELTPNIKRVIRHLMKIHPYEDGKTVEDYAHNCFLRWQLIYDEECESKCPCNADITRKFWIRNRDDPNHETWVGSVCIQSFGPDMFEFIEYRKTWHRGLVATFVKEDAEDGGLVFQLKNRESNVFVLNDLIRVHNAGESPLDAETGHVKLIPNPKKVNTRGLKVGSDYSIQALVCRGSGKDIDKIVLQITSCTSKSKTKNRSSTATREERDLNYERKLEDPDYEKKEARRSKKHPQKQRLISKRARLKQEALDRADFLELMEENKRYKAEQEEIERLRAAN